MRVIFINKFIVFMLGVMLVACLFVGTARAAAEEPVADEQALMALFFEEDDLVEAATGAPKPISQVAENVTIVTAEEIEAMNAHTVAEVLNRVAGIAVDYSGGQDFVGSAQPKIHGAEYEYIAVLVDGIRWRNVTNEFFETTNIPVHIIKRIEVIKGPASSTWGSAFGGVINIITKDTGADTRPAGTVSASFGEHKTYDIFAEAAGRAGLFSYYLYGGRQSSDGIRYNKFIDNNRFYAKVDINPRDNVRFSFTAGYTKPEGKKLHNISGGYELVYEDRTFFYTGALDLAVSEELHLNVSLHSFEDTLHNRYWILSNGLSDGDELYDGTTRGVSGRLVWNHNIHSVVLGGEYLRDKTVDTEKFYKLGPVTNRDENWAAYINDTMILGRFAVTPGIRYDNLGLSDNIVSPSLGITYRLNNTTLFRGLLSYGFKKTPINLTRETIWGPVFNPDLQAGEVRSVQLGMETSAMQWCRLKATLFRHDGDKVWTWDWDNSFTVNAVDTLHKGFEVEARTVPFYYFSMAANYTYVEMDSTFDGHSRHSIANLELDYDNPQIVFAQLYGHYVRWGEIIAPSSSKGKDGNVLWDLNFRKIFLRKGITDLELFGTIHNLTDGSQNTRKSYQTQSRWFEAGIRVHY